MTAKAISYWIATALVALAMLSGGIGEVVHQHDVIDGMSQLGYPPYFGTILGTWKILGVAVLLAPRLPRLKEWAYAGVIFDLTGASISHAVHGDNAFHIAVPLILALLAMVSWALRPQSRRLGVISGTEKLA